MITPQVNEKIKQIVRFFETSKITGARPDALTILPDGPGGIRQITYGESQTTEFGNLPILLKMYANAKGTHSAQIGTWLDKVGKQPSLHNNIGFTNLLKDAGKDPIMAKIQHNFFNKYYYQPAVDWFTYNQFTLPMSMLVIYDSYIHSGSIMALLRNRFSTSIPRTGGDEKEWVTNYVKVRDEWLENHSNRILRNTDYRTDSFIYNIRQGNWLLDKPFTIVNYPDNNEAQVPKIIANIP